MIRTRSLLLRALTPSLSAGLCSCAFSAEPLDENVEKAVQRYEIYRDATWGPGQQSVLLSNAGPTEFCALTGIRGRFRGDGEEVRVSRSSVLGQPGVYRWYLTGNSAQPANQGMVMAYATCIRHVQGYTGETLWSQGEASKDLGPMDDRACFLTRVRGHFEGDGEQVRIRAVDGRWRLDGTSQQLGVRAGARCVYTRPELIVPHYWIHNGGSGGEWLTTNAWGGPGDDNDFCALGRLQGRLSAPEDVALVQCDDQSGCFWRLGIGGSTTGPLGAGARCIRADIIVP